VREISRPLFSREVEISREPKDHVLYYFAPAFAPETIPAETLRKSQPICQGKEGERPFFLLHVYSDGAQSDDLVEAS
jgi:hypothetical protein